MGSHGSTMMLDRNLGLLLTLFIIVVIIIVTKIVLIRIIVTTIVIIIVAIRIVGLYKQKLRRKKRSSCRYGRRTGVFRVSS